MDERFATHVEALRPAFLRLREMAPVQFGRLPKQMPKAGVYLLSERDRDLYVGRSSDIRGRLGRHCRPGATHRMAAFAFRLAREQTGRLKAAYAQGSGTRDELMLNPAFVAAFNAAKGRIRAMDIRFVEETDPVRQALLEIYAAVVLQTPYNDFENH